MEILKMDNIKKSYDDKIVLNNFKLTIQKQSITAIVGESGSGKSTIMNIIGLLDDFDSGNYRILGHDNLNIGSKQAMLLRRSFIGYLYQNYALVDDFTVEENLKIATEYNSDITKQNLNEKLKISLQALNLEYDEIINKKIYQLSGGEQQRVAIARLLLKPCELILADEPTGSLDNKNKQIILDFLLKLNHIGKTIIIVTHDPDVMKACNNIIYL